MRKDVVKEWVNNYSCVKTSDGVFYKSISFAMLMGLLYKLKLLHSDGLYWAPVEEYIIRLELKK